MIVNDAKSEVFNQSSIVNGLRFGSDFSRHATYATATRATAASDRAAVITFAASSGTAVFDLGYRVSPVSAAIAMTATAAAFTIRASHHFGLVVFHVTLLPYDYTTLPPKSNLGFFWPIIRN